jgi:manganese transport protein
MICLSSPQNDALKGLIWSQIAQSIQFPFTVCPIILLTSSPKVMGQFVYSLLEKTFLGMISGIVFFLNMMLLFQTI